MSKKCLIFCIFVKKISFLNPQCVEKQFISITVLLSLLYDVKTVNSVAGPRLRKIVLRVLAPRFCQLGSGSYQENLHSGPGSKILLAQIRFLPRKIAFGSWLQDFASSDPVLTKKIHSKSHFLGLQKSLLESIFSPERDFEDLKK